MSRTQIGCCWVLANGERCGKRTRYRMVPDDDDTAHREYDTWCEEHAAKAEAQTRQEEFEESLPDLYFVRVNQARGKPAPVRYGKVRWSPFIFTVRAVVSGPVVTQFREHQFDNYELRVELDLPVDEDKWKLFRADFERGRMAVEVVSGPS